jgi:FkbM family methyltransferase
MVSGAVDRIKLSLLRVLGNLHRLVIGPYGAAVLSRTENGLLLTPAGDFMVGRRLCFKGRYDPELVHLLSQKCKANSQVLFVGAHVGALAIPVAQRVTKVAAVEANPSTFELLRMNVALNGLQNVDVYNFAAGDRNSEVEFLASRLNSGGSGIAIGEWDRWAYAYDKPERIEVQMRRLDDAFPGASFQVIVMDIEGSEALALKGMHGLLSRCQGLLVEVFENHLRHIAKVSDDEFLSLVVPFFDEATILPEKPRSGRVAPIGPYLKNAFPEMMRKCCELGMANVFFGKRET